MHKHLKDTASKWVGWASHYGFTVIIAAAIPVRPRVARAAETYPPFEGEKSAWRDGFDRYDYVMGEATPAIATARISLRLCLGQPRRGHAALLLWVQRIPRRTRRRGVSRGAAQGRRLAKLHRAHRAPFSRLMTSHTYKHDN